MKAKPVCCEVHSGAYTWVELWFTDQYISISYLAKVVNMTKELLPILPQSKDVCVYQVPDV